MTLRPGIAPEQQTPTVFQEINPEQLVELGRAVGTLAYIKIPESAQGALPEHIRPYAADGPRLVIASFLKRGVPKVLDALPAAQLVKEHIEADTDIKAAELLPHMPAIRALVPTVQSALRLAPELMANGDEKREHAIMKRLHPVEKKLRQLQFVIKLGLGKKIDKRLARETAGMINKNRDQIYSYMQWADEYIEPLSKTVETQMQRFPQPKKQLMDEASDLAAAIWQGSTPKGQPPTGKRVGQAIETELRFLLQDKDALRKRLPMLSALGLDRLTNLPELVAVDDTLAINAVLQVTGTQTFVYRDKRGIPVPGKVGIRLADALGVIAPDIMYALEATAHPTKHGNFLLGELRDAPHPLRSAANLKSSIESDLSRLRSFGTATRAAKDLLPNDISHARRMVIAVTNAVRLKPRKR